MNARQFFAVVESIGRTFSAHNTPAARCLLLAIAGQESGWSQRIQQPGGQARGYWQCEKNGGVLAALEGHDTRDELVRFCQAIDVPPGLDEVYEAIAWNDTLAYLVARLNLLLDPPPLPAIGDITASWATYLRVWKPGKPDESRWMGVYPQCAALYPGSSSSSVTS
jgi:hypothetical protein